METEGATPEDWELLAKETLMQYYNRGGHGLGDVFQLLEGSNFINTIGYSLSLCPNINMKNWSSEHYKLAREGLMCYYEGKNLEAIEKVTTKLQAECNGSREIFVTILPISFFFSGSLFTLPLYRFKKVHDEKEEKFMDHTGRVYRDFEDWRENNTLPATKILYPRNGRLSLKNNEEGKVDCVLEDSAECCRPVKSLMALDIASGTVGILGGIAATTIATGGTALLLMGAVAISASYGAGRTGFKIKDRVQHNETVNPLKNREAFWLWLGLGADLVTFGTLSIASAKFLSTFTQSTALVDISRKFGAATRAMSIFSGTMRPVSDSAHVLFTGYEIFSKLRHKSTKSVLKLPKNSLMQLNDAMDEFSESNMLMMAITEGFWSKTKMCYCSPEEFIDMVQDIIIIHMAEFCSDKKLFEDLRCLLQNDAELIETYKHFDEDSDFDEMIRLIYEVFVSNNDKMEIKLLGKTCEIKLNLFHLSIRGLNKLTPERREKIFERLRSLNEEQQIKLATIHDHTQNNEDFLRMIDCDNALDYIDAWYDVFVICFDEYATTIAEQEKVIINNQEISLNLLRKFPREERLNIIFELKNLNDTESLTFKSMLEKAENSEEKYKLYRKLAYEDEKANLFVKLDESLH